MNKTSRATAIDIICVVVGLAAASWMVYENFSNLKPDPSSAFADPNEHVEGTFLIQTIDGRFIRVPLETKGPTP